MAYASLGLACLAGDREEWPWAAELHGVAQAFLDHIGQPWLEPYLHFRQASVDTVRASLGEDEFRRIYAAGLTLSFDEAVDLALLRAGSDIRRRAGAC